MAISLKERCMEYSVYDIEIPLENIVRRNDDPLSVDLSFVSNNEIKFQKTFHPTPSGEQLQLTNPLRYRIPGRYNQIDGDKKEERRNIIISAYYDKPDSIITTLYTEDFSYWVDKAHIKAHLIGLANIPEFSGSGAGYGSAPELEEVEP